MYDIVHNLKFEGNVHDSYYYYYNKNKVKHSTFSGIFLLKYCCLY